MNCISFMYDVYMYTFICIWYILGKNFLFCFTILHWVYLNPRLGKMSQALVVPISDPTRYGPSNLPCLETVFWRWVSGVSKSHTLLENNDICIILIYIYCICSFKFTYTYTVYKTAMFLFGTIPEGSTFSFGCVWATESSGRKAWRGIRVVLQS